MANRQMLAMIASMIAISIAKQAPPDHGASILLVIDEMRIPDESIAAMQCVPVDCFIDCPTFADAYIQSDDSHVRLPRPNGGQKGAALAHLARDDVGTVVVHGACC